MVDVIVEITDKYKVKIDKKFIKLVKSNNWHSRENSCGQVYFDSKLGRLHRIILNCPSDLVVDHINGDSLDNRKSNLRACTHKENIRNQKKHKNATHSRYKGVTFRKNLKKKPWESFIYPNGKSLRLGYFSTEVEAAKAYDRAAIIHYGEFCKLNFP